jgi:hypothetical protein
MRTVAGFFSRWAILGAIWVWGMGGWGASELGASPIVIYHFDEGTGTTAYDSVGSAHGTINGATWTTGKFGYALSFDGSDDYVSVSSFPSGSYSQLTVEAWIYPQDKEGKQVLINEQNGDTLWMNFDTNGSDKLDIYLGDTTNKGYHSSNTAIARNTWSHVAFTYNDTTDELKLYINGQLDRTITTSGMLNFDTTIVLGGREYGNLEFFKGLIDEVAFYNRVLSAEEIRARYLDGPPPGIPEPASGVLLVIGLALLAARTAWGPQRAAGPQPLMAPTGEDPKG